ETLQEPIWRLMITEPAEMDSVRRRMLFRQKLDNQPLDSGKVKTGLNARKQFYPEDSWFHVELDTASCILCGACLLYTSPSPRDIAPYLGGGGG
ncbi:hypothetical protein ACNQ3M_26500, partial [Enterobacter cloacae complex sp.6701988]